MDMSMFSLKNKVAVITGGNKGIGKAITSCLAKAGADIVVLDADDATPVTDEVAEKYKVRAAAFVCDVTKPEEVDETIAKAAKKMGTLDVLFNNAGICLHKAAVEVTPEEWLKVINVNLNGEFFVARALRKVSYCA